MLCLFDCQAPSWERNFCSLTHSCDRSNLSGNLSQTQLATKLKRSKLMPCLSQHQCCVTFLGRHEQTCLQMGNKWWAKVRTPPKTNLVSRHVLFGLLTGRLVKRYLQKLKWLNTLPISWPIPHVWWLMKGWDLELIAQPVESRAGWRDSGSSSDLSLLQEVFLSSSLQGNAFGLGESSSSPYCLYMHGGWSLVKPVSFRDFLTSLCVCSLSLKSIPADAMFLPSSGHSLP